MDWEQIESSCENSTKALSESSIIVKFDQQSGNLQILISQAQWDEISRGNEKEMLNFTVFVNWALFRFRVKVKALRSREDRDLRLAGECIYVGEKWKDSRWWCNAAGWVRNELVSSRFRKEAGKDNDCREKFMTTHSFWASWRWLTHGIRLFSR